MKVSQLKENQIYQTSDYDMFVMSPYNRDIKNPKRMTSLKRIESCMSKYGFFSSKPIRCKVVDNKLQIDDGQGRYTIAKKLNIPLWFVVDNNKNISIPETQGMEQKWSIEDYVITSASQGNTHCSYAILWSKTNGIDLKIAMSLLIGNTALAGNVIDKLKSGSYAIKDIEYANTIAWIAESLSDVFKRSKDARFLNALSQVMRVLYFDPKHFVKKGKNYPQLFKICGSNDEWLDMIENIYNYKSTKANQYALAFDTKQIMHARRTF